MAEVMRCDICGAIYPRWIDSDDEMCYIKKYNQKNDRLDLCPECTIKLYSVLDSLKDKKEEKEAENGFTDDNIKIMYQDDLLDNTRYVYSNVPLSEKQKEEIRQSFLEEFGIPGPCMNIVFEVKGE